jgi:hypothetical protein
MRSKNISFANTDSVSAQIANLTNSLLKGHFKERVIAINKLFGGSNSDAYKILTDKSNEYFVKKYQIRKSDIRNRLSTEFSGLSFLWKNGIRNIPEPITACEKSRIAVYRFIRGIKIKSGEMSLGDVEQSADFVGQLKSLTSAQGADLQPVASEACFSIKEYINCIEDRLRSLNNSGKRGIVFRSLRLYLDHEFMPVYRYIIKITSQKAKRIGIDINEEIRKCERTLSPSDFGFHNVIKVGNGSLFFIDFEYYGWDDPVKMVSDFYLQPAVHVPVDYREHFFRKIRKNYSQDARLEQRLSLIYPLLGLKWCLIMLNVINRFGESENDEVKCLNRIDRSAEKLEAIRREIEIQSFPLSLV